VTNPWSPPTSAPAAAPPVAAAPGHPLPPARPLAYPGAYPVGYAAPPAAARASRTAVAALVVACIALTGVVLMSLLAVVPMLFVGGMMSGGMGGGGMFPEEEYELLGTLPAAEPAREYPDDLLLAEVERTLEADWSTHSGLECESLGVLEEGAATTCTGTVDGVDEELDLVVEDELGHFTLTYFW
jgi:hypothetical protein